MTDLQCMLSKRIFMYFFIFPVLLSFLILAEGNFSSKWPLDLMTWTKLKFWASPQYNLFQVWLRQLDPTGVWTYNLQIMNRTFHVPEVLILAIGPIRNWGNIALYVVGCVSNNCNLCKKTLHPQRVTHQNILDTYRLCQMLYSQGWTTGWSQSL